MTEFRDRSTLFKFFYIVLRIITFPIFLVLFVFMHPLWLFFIVLMVTGGAVYWPMSQGVKTDEILAWYQQKYVVARKDVVKYAKEKGMVNYVPQAMVKEVEQQEDVEARKEHGENYNIKVKQDEKSVATKEQLRKRSGFKKATVGEVSKVEKNVEDMTHEEILEESGTQGSGLADFIISHEGDDLRNEAETKVTEENSEVKEKIIVTDGVETDSVDVHPQFDADVEGGDPLPEKAINDVQPETDDLASEEHKVGAPIDNDDELELF